MNRPRRKKSVATGRKPTTRSRKKNVKEEEIISIVESTDTKKRDKKITLGTTITAKNQLYSKSLLSKSAALARIQQPILKIIEEDLANQLEELPGRWKEVAKKPALFDGFKQIVAHLDWPREITTDETGVVWNVRDLYRTLTVPTFGLIQGKNSIFSEGLIDRVEYYPFSSDAEKRTRVRIPFPEPSPHHLRTIRNLMDGVTWAKKNDDPILTVEAPTFYECWVKAGLVANLCCYQLSRSDIRSGEAERFWLQALGEIRIQNEILREILSTIGLVQIIQQRFLPEREKKSVESIETILQNPIAIESSEKEMTKIDGRALLASIQKEKEEEETNSSDFV